MTSYPDIFKQVKQASKSLALISDDKRNQVLRRVADAIDAHTDELLKANAEDLQLAGPDYAFKDRLLLTADRLSDIAASMRHVATLPSPLGHVLKDKTLPNGLHLQRVSVPLALSA